MNDKKIIVALDSNNFYELKNLVNEIKSHVFAFKIGYEFFLNFGLDGYKFIQNKNVNIFLDLKLHDIPNTIKNSIETIANLNPYFTTIHISGGDKMQQMANLSKKNVKLLGVTILTSLDNEQTEKYYNSKNINDLIYKFVKFCFNLLNSKIFSHRKVIIINVIARLISTCTHSRNPFIKSVFNCFRRYFFHLATNLYHIL